MLYTIEESVKNTNILFSEDDIYINFDAFESGEKNACFIHGLSGGGKSTLSRKIAEQYKCKLVEIDVISFKITGEKAHKNGRQTWDYIKDQDIMLYKYMKEKGLEPDFMRDITSNGPDNPTSTEEEIKTKIERTEQYIHWLCFEQKERVVIEGGYAGVVLINYKEYQDFPLIIKGTSIAKSIFRRIKRSLANGDSIFKILTQYPSAFIDQYSNMIPEVNTLRKIMIKDNNYKYVKESMDYREAFLLNKSSVILESVFDKKYETLDEFCKYIKTPEEAMQWYKYNEIKWPENKDEETKYKYNEFNGKAIFKGKDKYIGCELNTNVDEYLNKIKYKKIPVRKEPQPCITLNDGCDYRVRVEIIVLNDNNEILVDTKKGRGGASYSFPGGGLDKGDNIISTATHECKEEALIIPENIQFMNISWILHFPNTDFYQGALTFVCVGKYKKDYTGYVKKEDRDLFATRATWEDYTKLNLLKPHKKAIERYLENNNMNEEFKIDRTFLDANYD